MSLLLSDGDRSGKLQIVRQAEKHECSPNQSRYKCYVCKCDCGNTKIVASILLHPDSYRQTLSCGCLRKETASRMFKLPREERLRNRKYTEYTASAKKRNIFFDLSKDELYNFTKELCFYCGSAAPNGVDRINNDEGYILNNCVPCCVVCNRAKNSMSLFEFEEWIDRLITHQNGGHY